MAKIRRFDARRKVVRAQRKPTAGSVAPGTADESPKSPAAVREHALGDPDLLTPSDVLSLRRTIGNAATNRLLARRRMSDDHGPAVTSSSIQPVQRLMSYAQFKKYSSKWYFGDRTKILPIDALIKRYHAEPEHKRTILTDLKAGLQTYAGKRKIANLIDQVDSEIASLPAVPKALTVVGGPRPALRSNLGARGGGVAPLAGPKGTALHPVGSPSAPVNAGTTTHPILKAGDGGYALEELRQKLAALGYPSSVTDTFSASTERAVKGFQTAKAIPVTGVADVATWNAIDATGVGSTKGEVNKTWEENDVGGVTYGMTSAYTWEIMENEVRVEVQLNFTLDDGVSARFDEWLNETRQIWNAFKIVNTASGKSLNLKFAPVGVKGVGHNNVNVKAGADRSNARDWYADDPGIGKVAAHEFGHMIGLEDEYQRSHRDYQRLTGVAPGAGTANATPVATVAAELRAAILTADYDARVAAVHNVIATRNLGQGDYAHSVDEEFKRVNGRSFVSAASDARYIHGDDQWHIVNPFTVTGGSLMGVRDEITHAHPVEPRHVRDFVNFVAAAKPGQGEARRR